MKGSYCLVAYLRRGSIITFGNGSSFFPRGWYAYVGSAMNGIEPRVQRHLSHHKKAHWHIDFLLEKAVLKAIFAMPSEVRKECHKAAALKAIGGMTVAKKFGSTDCKCETHLYFFSHNPLRRKDFLEVLLR